EMIEQQLARALSFAAPNQGYCGILAPKRLPIGDFPGENADELVGAYLLHRIAGMDKEGDTIAGYRDTEKISFAIEQQSRGHGNIARPRAQVADAFPRSAS